jgi:hypothetical protein
VGLALANFTGTYLLVEPNEDAILNVVCIHAKVMPHARVIGLRMDAMALALVSSAMLHNITGVDPSKVRLLVGNHAIDDMILAATFSSLEQVPRGFEFPASQRYVTTSYSDGGLLPRA